SPARRRGPWIIGAVVAAVACFGCCGVGVAGLVIWRWTAAPAVVQVGTQAKRSATVADPFPETTKIAPSTTKIPTAHYGPPTIQVPTKPFLVLDADGHTATVKKVLFTPDKQRVISVAFDRTIRVWDVASGETVHIIRPAIGDGLFGSLQAAALSPDG